MVDKCSKSFINCLSMTSFEHNKICGILPHIFADLDTSSWNCFQINYNSLWQPDDLSFMFRREATVAWDWWLIRRLMPGRQYLSGLHWSALYLTNPFGWSGRKSLWTFDRITQSIWVFFVPMDLLHLIIVLNCLYFLRPFRFGMTKPFRLWIMQNWGRIPQTYFMW